MIPTIDSTHYHHAFPFREVPLSSADTVADLSLKLSPSIFDSSTKINEFLSPLNLHESAHFQPFWLLIISMLLLALIGNLMYRQYKNYLLSFFTIHRKNINAEREERLGLLSYIINLFFVLNLSLFLMRMAELQHWQIPFTNPWQQYFIIVAVVFAFWIAKYIITLILHLIFTSYRNGLELLKINQQVEFVLFVTLIPTNFLFYYAINNSVFSYYIIGLLLVILLSGMIKLFLHLKLISAINTYQIFIYLCTLEILPILVIIKFLS